MFDKEYIYRMQLKYAEYFHRKYFLFILGANLIMAIKLHCYFLPFIQAIKKIWEFQVLNKIKMILMIKITL